MFLSYDENDTTRVGAQITYPIVDEIIDLSTHIGR